MDIKTQNIIKKLEAMVINGGIFIIPNHAPKIDNYYPNFREKKFNYMSAICAANGVEFDRANDHCIETWFFSHEMNCDNICDHSIHMVDDDTKITISVPSDRQIPECLLKGKKEGDILDIKLPVIVAFDGCQHAFVEKGGVEIVMNFKFELCQKKTRYERFGNFEDVLYRVTH